VVLRGRRAAVRGLTVAAALGCLLSLAACTTTWAPSAGPEFLTPSPRATASGSADGSGVEASWGKPTTTIDFATSRPDEFANRDLQPAGRACSPIEDKNTTVKDGVLDATVSRITDAARIKKLDAAARTAQKAAKQAALVSAQKLSGTQRDEAMKKAQAMPTNGCAYGAFENAMVGTQGRLGLATGKVSVRVKFPVDQGMHFAVWLQSEQPLGIEIDFIEAYGYGKGLSSGIHVRRQDGSFNSNGGKILKTEVKQKDWWSKYHIFSVAWDLKGFTFYADGVQIRHIDQASTPDNYYLVLSGLTSDWELPYLTNPSGSVPDLQPAQLPASMQVDWIKIWKD